MIAEGANVDNPADDTENRGVFIVDEDECTACGDCVDTCYFNSVSLNDADVAAVDSDKCMG